MSNLKEVSKNTIFQMIAKSATVSVSLFITALITRQLTVSDYGEFVKIMSFVSIFYLIADFGFNATFLKLTPPDKIKNDFNKFFALRFITSSLLTLFCILIALSLPHNASSGTGFSNSVKFGIFLASFTILFQGLYNALNAIFQKNLRYDLSSVATIISSVATLILIIIVIPFKNIYLLVLSYTFANTVLFLVSYKLLGKLTYKPKFVFDKTYSKSLSLSSISLGVALVINLIYFRIDTIILGFIRSPEEVGFYGLAYRIFETVLVVPIFFSNALFPVFLNHLNDRKVLIRIFKKSVLLLGVISMALSVIFFLTADLIINLISGPSFSYSANILRILSLGYPFFFLSAIVMWLLITFNKQKILSILYLIVGTANCVANLYFIPQYGAYASAYITVISEILILVGGSIILIHKLKND
ncbi:flippase [Patescibacteria group bacterium]|nr:flippase [Patescibacteria group bacterium]